MVRFNPLLNASCTRDVMRIALLIAALFIVPTGCSNGSMDKNVIQSGEVGLAEATKLVEGNQWLKPFPFWTNA